MNSIKTTPRTFRVGGVDGQHGDRGAAALPAREGDDGLGGHQRRQPHRARAQQRRGEGGLYGYTRAHCYSSLKFVVPIGIPHTKEEWGGIMTKGRRLSRPSAAAGTRPGRPPRRLGSARIVAESEIEALNMLVNLV